MGSPSPVFRPTAPLHCVARSAQRRRTSLLCARDEPLRTAVRMRCRNSIRGDRGGAGPDNRAAYLASPKEPRGREPYTANSTQVLTFLAWAAMGNIELEVLGPKDRGRIVATPLENWVEEAARLTKPERVVYCY